MVNKTSSNTREAARNEALKEGSGAEKHRKPGQGRPHFHPTTKKGKSNPPALIMSIPTGINP